VLADQIYIYLTSLIQWGLNNWRKWFVHKPNTLWLSASGSSLIITVWRNTEMHTVFWWGNPEERVKFEHVSVDWRLLSYNVKWAWMPWDGYCGSGYGKMASCCVNLMKHWVPYNSTNFLICWVTISFSRRPLLRGVN
jgi:hypothetical protein